MKEPSKILSIAVSIYAITISIWFGLWLFLGDVTWWLTILNRFALFLFVPAPVLLAWCLFTRCYKALAILVIPALIFGRLYHPYLFPRAAAPVDGSSELKIMTYNVLYSNSDYDAVANVIQSYQPDLIALQEVQPSMLAALEEQMADDYPFALLGTEDDYGTTAVFSRYPITDSSILDLQAGRPAVVTKVRFDEKDITFASLHMLAYNLWHTKWKDLPSDIDQRTTARDLQVKSLMEQLDGENGIVIVGCDCNSYETSGSYRIFDRSMDNAARQVGWILDSREPNGARRDTDLLHIDYVWYRGPITPVRVYKIKDAGGSDHLPVLTIFQLP